MLGIKEVKEGIKGILSPIFPIFWKGQKEACLSSTDYTPIRTRLG